MKRSKSNKGTLTSGLATIDTDNGADVGDLLIIRIGDAENHRLSVSIINDRIGPARKRGESIKTFHGVDVLVLEKYLADATNALIEKTQDRVDKRLSALAEFYADDTPIPKYSAKKAEMIAKAQAKVIKSTNWLTAKELSDFAGFKSTNASAQPAKWKAAKKIFSVKYKSQELFPSYAIDAQNGHRPIGGLQEVLREFGDTKDGWGLAYWFASVNGYLGGESPQNLLATNPGLVLKAAKDELMGIQHG